MDINKSNKLSRYRLFQKNTIIAKAIPVTKILSEENFWEMMNKYDEVIIKPIIGRKGAGILKAVKLNRSLYEVKHTSGQKVRFTRKSKLLAYIKSETKNFRKYIIQYCIPLADIDGSPFDIRVLVQKKTGHEWKVTGSYIRVAKSGHFVTNLAKGGNVLGVSEGLSKAGLKMKMAAIEKFKQDIKSFSLKFAKHMEKYYPDQTIWGLDLGVDVNRKIWLIEDNYKPGIQGYKQLKNQRMYKTIVRTMNYNKRKLKNSKTNSKRKSKNRKNYKRRKYKKRKG